MLLVAATILVDADLSYPNFRNFVDFLFIEGMAAIIAGSFLVAQSLKRFISISNGHEDSESTSISPKAKANHRALGMRILIVGVFLVLFVIIIGEMWIRKLA